MQQRGRGRWRTGSQPVQRRDLPPGVGGPRQTTYCEFKQALSYGTPKEKAELVKDVSSFANTDLEAIGGHGYIVFGVSNDGRIVGIADV